LISGSRKQKELSAEEIERIAAVYREFKRERAPAATSGFCRVATLDEVRQHGWALTSGRYVGSSIEDQSDESFEERLPTLVARLYEQLERSKTLGDEIKTQLGAVLVDD